MAQKVQVVLVDDIDGGHADETVRFGLDGTNYEIDLSSAHARELRDALASWVAAGRKVTGRSAARPRTSDDTSKIRAWAKSNGYAVSERGRIAADIRAAYNAAR